MTFERETCPSHVVLKAEEKTRDSRQTRRSSVEKNRKMGSEAKKEVKHLLVDLDGTLYRSAQLFADVRANIEGKKRSPKDLHNKATRNA